MATSSRAEPRLALAGAGSGGDGGGRLFRSPELRAALRLLRLSRLELLDEIRTELACDRAVDAPPPGQDEPGR